jgi:hypothetical protein
MRRLSDCQLEYYDSTNASKGMAANPIVFAAG